MFAKTLNELTETMATAREVTQKASTIAEQKAARKLLEEVVAKFKKNRIKIAQPEAMKLLKSLGLGYKEIEDWHNAQFYMRQYCDFYQGPAIAQDMFEYSQICANLALEVTYFVQNCMWDDSEYLAFKDKIEQQINCLTELTEGKKINSNEIISIDKVDDQKTWQDLYQKANIYTTANFDGNKNRTKVVLVNKEVKIYWTLNSRMKTRVTRIVLWFENAKGDKVGIFEDALGLIYPLVISDLKDGKGINLTELLKEFKTSLSELVNS